MCVGEIISAGASLLGGAMGNRAANRAADAQIQAGRELMNNANSAASNMVSHSAFARMGRAGGAADGIYHNLLGLNGAEAMANTVLPGLDRALEVGRQTVEQSGIVGGYARSSKMVGQLARTGADIYASFRDKELDRLGGVLAQGDAVRANEANIRVGAATNNAQLQQIAAENRAGGTQAIIDGMSGAATAIGSIFGNKKGQAAGP